MQRRQYRVKQLTEFYPKQENLLGINVNRGAKISLRLRSPHNEHEFLNEEDVLGTMLHELCHCVHGPHDAKFYALLDDLQLECATGVKKVPFAGSGTVLGGSGTLKTHVVTGGQQLGGTGNARVERGQIGGPEDLKRRVAEAAARRAHDAKWCGAGREEDPILLEDEMEAAAEVAAAETLAIKEHERTRQSHVDETMINQRKTAIDRKKTEMKGTDLFGKAVPLEVIEIDSDDEVEPLTQLNTSKKRSMAEEQEAKDYQTMKRRGLLQDSLHEHLQKSQHMPVRRKVDPTSIDGTWECPICTLRNTLSIEACHACQTARPAVPLSKEDYWRCETCDLFNLKTLWMCTGCHSIKTSS